MGYLKQKAEDLAPPTGQLNLGVNREEPLVMHVDLNSCFATI